MKDKIKGVDMDAVMDYMIKNDCRLDEAIEAVSAGLSDSVSDRKPATSVKKSAEVSDRVIKDSLTTEKPKTKLKSARIVAGLSQSALAEKTGLKLRTLQAYEQGHKSLDNASFGTVVKIAEACGCKFEHLIEDSELLNLLKNYKCML